MPIPAGPDLSFIAAGQPLDASKVSGELAYIESKVADFSGSTPVTIPGPINFGNDVGAPNAAIVILTPPPSAIPVGFIVTFTTTFANTGATTLSVNGTTGPLTANAGADLFPNTIVNPCIVRAIRRATTWELLDVNTPNFFPNLAAIPAAAGVIPAANLPTVGLLNVQIFSASGTWTKPVGFTNVVCDCIIVGAGGGGGASGGGVGFNGGLGGRVSVVFGFLGLPSISAATLPVVVGTGGTVGAGAGGAGGDSSFNGIICGGGGGGSPGGGGGSVGADGASPQGGTSPTFNPTAIPYFGYNGGSGGVTTITAPTAGSNGVVIIRTYSA